jgi:hypothetical protein
MSLYAKMAQIMAEIPFLPKDGTNEHFKYPFVTDATVYNEVRRLLAEKGIALFASMTGVEQQRFVKKVEKDGTERAEWHTLVHFEFILVDSETGETKSSTWSAESLDSQDKGINKCATAALKYWLLKTFIIPTGDDPDAEVPATPAKPKKTAAPAAPRPNGKPAPAPAAPAPAPTPATDKPHWSQVPETRANFDRAMSYNHVAESTIQTALGAEDPAVPVDTLLRQYDAVGEAIAAVLTYIREHEEVPA